MSCPGDCGNAELAGDSRRADRHVPVRGPAGPACIHRDVRLRAEGCIRTNGQSRTRPIWALCAGCVAGQPAGGVSGVDCYGVRRERVRPPPSFVQTAEEAPVEPKTQTPKDKRQQPAGQIPLAEVVCNRKVERRRADSVENGHAINHVLQASVSGSRALAGSGRDFRARVRATVQARRNGCRLTSRRQRQHPIGATETTARS